MPSKRKRKLRENKLFTDSGWFTVTSDMWLDPGQRPRKLRFISDANLPDGLGEQMKRYGFNLRTARSLKLNHLSDEDLLRRVSARGCVLITMDRDFWSDTKFPLHHAGAIVFVDGKDERIAESQGFGLLLAFLKLFGGWKQGKFRASADRVHLKMISHANEKCVYELCLFPDGVCGREVEGFEAD